MSPIITAARRLAAAVFALAVLSALLVPHGAQAQTKPAKVPTSWTVTAVESLPGGLYLVSFTDGMLPVRARTDRYPAPALGAVQAHTLLDVSGARRRVQFTDAAGNVHVSEPALMPDVTPTPYPTPLPTWTPAPVRTAPRTAPRATATPLARTRTTGTRP